MLVSSAGSTGTATRIQHGFLEKKIADNKAQILCRDCELKKTFQGSPGNPGTNRPRRLPL